MGWDVPIVLNVFEEYPETHCQRLVTCHYSALTVMHTAVNRSGEEAPLNKKRKKGGWGI